MSTPTTSKKKEYQVIEIRIGKMPATEELYDLESKRNAAIKACAEEWQRVVQEQIGKVYPFFEAALPTAFYDMMVSYDSAAGICASMYFLRKHGYEVKKVKI